MNVKTNFLEETMQEIIGSNHGENEIAYVVVRFKPHNLANVTWESFKKAIKGFEYDAGYGLNEISLMCKIVFTDGNYLERHEYDGAENWWYVVVPKLDVEVVEYNPEIHKFKESWYGRGDDDDE